MMGRPLTFKQETADAICERLACGESLRAICRDDGFPSEATVRGWARDDVAAFAAQYARAREIGYDCMAEQILELADKSRLGRKVVRDKDGISVTEADMVDRTKLQIDVRKWLLSKMLPKRYGEKLQTEHSGSIGVTVAASRTDEDL